MIAKAPMVLIFLADMQLLHDYFENSHVPELCKKTGTSYAKPQKGDLLLATNDAIVAAESLHLGQHIYLRKFSSGFMKEMRRSFKAGRKVRLEG